MCRRSKRKDDPLVDLFLTKYKLNLLPLPLENADCGQVYVKRPGAKLGAVPGSIAELVTPEVRLPAARRNRPMPDIAGERSSAVSAKVGLNLLDNFLTALGAAAGIVNEIRAGYERNRASQVRFAFRDATRDSMDPFSIGTALIDHSWNARHPWIGDGNQYYVSAAVVRCPSLSITAEDDRSQGVDVGLDALNAVGVNAAISVQRHDRSSVTYQGRKRLAIGVELYDLRYDSERAKFEMGTEDVAVDLRRGREVELVPAFAGDDDEALVEAEELGTRPSTSAGVPPG
jgi:hypothetical protein